MRGPAFWQSAATCRVPLRPSYRCSTLAVGSSIRSMHANCAISSGKVASTSYEKVRTNASDDRRSSSSLTSYNLDKKPTRRHTSAYASMRDDMRTSQRIDNHREAFHLEAIPSCELTVAREVVRHHGCSHVFSSTERS